MAFSMFCFNVLHIYSSFKILDYVQCKVCVLWHLQLENWEVAIKKTLKLEMPCFDDLVLILIIVPRLNCNHNSHFLIAILHIFFIQTHKLFPIYIAKMLSFKLATQFLLICSLFCQLLYSKSFLGLFIDSQVSTYICILREYVFFICISKIYCKNIGI